MRPDRDDYYRTCLERGVPEAEAAAIADALIRARARVAEGLPGWEKVVHAMPRTVSHRAVHTFGMAVASNPSQSQDEQIRSGIQAALCYGVFVGMRLAEGGHLPSQREREAAAVNMPEIDQWLAELAGSGV